MRRATLWPVMDMGADEGANWLRWLVRLRWVAILGQIVTLSFVVSVLDSPWVLLPLGAVMVVLSLANARALRRLMAREEVGELSLLAHLTLDVLALTAFFLLAGGPTNPFTTLYVVHVAMAAVMMRAGPAAVLTLLVVACYASLHIGHLPLHMDAHSLPEQTLVRLGAGIAFALTSVSVAVFVVGVATTLRARSRQLLEARDRTARTDRLRSVGTLAAGAAHELNTPLSTIGLRVRRLGRRHDDPESARDLAVIQAQLDRCRVVVEQLLAGAGDPSAGGWAQVPLAALVSDAVDLWRPGSDVPAEVEDRTGGLSVDLPRVAFTQALINLLENAREAQHEAGCSDPIRVLIEREDGAGVVRILDQGTGLPSEAERVGEPFYTTKSTGTGLGVFVARAVADGAGGGLSYHSCTGGGTEARWWFPEAPRRTA